MIRSMTQFFLLFALAIASLVGLSACTGAIPVGAAASGLVARYCATPELGRVALRETIARQTAPNRIQVECAGDAL